MKSFSILLIKILALYLALTTLYSFLPVVFSGNVNSLFPPKLLAVVSATVLLPIISGIALWKYAECIADKIYTNEPELNKCTDVEIVSAGLFLIGISLLIKHIGIFLNHYLSMGQINYGSIFVILISILLVFRSSIFKNIYSKYSNNR
ncbi:hypothetical protein [Shewanella sp. OMA3-2]|uniref:hypothetical protein n=1 Tax=Shewanella sp. OMA3-2 TaxID=2908650 RepID=UPI001F419449|nr:hypothetical protein [Shewanella sp. OMA3-2]UJF20455.1 hypothetical protein L0B17_09460 [Shewanella sp. OMA3-2]